MFSTDWALPCTATQSYTYKCIILYGYLYLTHSLQKYFKRHNPQSEKKMLEVISLYNIASLCMSHTIWTRKLIHVETRPYLRLNIISGVHRLSKNSGATSKFKGPEESHESSATLRTHKC